MKTLIIALSLLVSSQAFAVEICNYGPEYQKAAQRIYAAHDVLVQKRAISDKDLVRLVRAMTDAVSLTDSCEMAQLLELKEYANVMDNGRVQRLIAPAKPTQVSTGRN